MKKNLVITLLMVTVTATVFVGCGKKDTAEVSTEGTEVVMEVETETTEETVKDEKANTEEETEEESTELVFDNETDGTDVVSNKTDADGTGKTTASKNDNSNGKTNNTNSTTTPTTTNTPTDNGSTSQNTNNGSDETKPNTNDSDTNTSIPSETDAPSVESPKNYCPYPLWTVIDFGDGYVGYYRPACIGQANYEENWSRCCDELYSGAWGSVEVVPSVEYGPFDDDFGYVYLERIKKLEG